MADTTLTIGVVGEGSQEFAKIEKQIRKIRQASVEAVEEQIQSLERLFKVRPERIKDTQVEQAASRALQRMKELGSQAHSTGGDVASANRVIAQSILEVIQAMTQAPTLAGAAGAGFDPGSEPGAQFHPGLERWLGPKGMVAGETAPFVEELIRQLRELQHRFLATAESTSYYSEELGRSVGYTKEFGGIQNRIIDQLNAVETKVIETAGVIGREAWNVRFRWREAAESFAQLSEVIGLGETGIASAIGTLRRWGAEFPHISRYTGILSSRLSELQENLKLFQLIAKAGIFVSREWTTDFRRTGEVLTALKVKVVNVTTVIAGMAKPVLLLVAALVSLYGMIKNAKVAFDAIGKGINWLKQQFSRLISAIKRVIQFFQNLAETIWDTLQAIYKFIRSVASLAKSIAERMVGAIRTLVGALGNLIPSFKQSEEVADRTNRTFYLTTRRSYEAARAVDYFSSVAAGFTTGMSLARGNLTALAMSMHWMRRTIIPVMAGVAALTLSVAGLASAFKTVTERAVEFGSRAQDVIRHFGAIAKSAEEGVQYWMASSHWAIKYGRDLEEVRDSLVSFYQSGLDTNEMLDASHALAAAWNMELSQAAGIIKNAVGEQEGQIESLREYGITVDGVTNSTERNARATAIAAAVMDKYSDAAEAYVQSLSGAMQRARSVIEYFWEVLTQPLAAQVLAPLINAFANFGSTIIALTMALWNSSQAQSYFNRTISIARGLVERFRPEITVLGNIVRLVVTAAFWGLQAALRAATRAMEQLLIWTRSLFNWFTALIRPIKPLADMFRQLGQSWKDIAFTELLQRAKEFVLDFPITLLGLETNLRELLGIVWNNLVKRLPEHLKAFVGSLGSQLLLHLAGIKNLSVSSVIGAFVTFLLNWLGRSLQGFLTLAFPELEDTFEKMFDMARWMSIIGGAFFGVRGALIGYLAGLLAGYLDDAFDLGIHEWISTGLDTIGEYFRSKWDLFWENLFVRDEQDPSSIVGINFDAAFTALAESFKDDWNNIFKPAIRDFLGMPDEGAEAISDYIGHAFKTAFSGATWVVDVMIKLFNILVKAWDDHVVPVWRDYIKPELENLWDEYLREPLEKLGQQWRAFWTVLFGGDYEVDVDWDTRFWSDDWDPDIWNPYYEMEQFVGGSNILSWIQDIAEEIGNFVDRLKEGKIGEFVTDVENLASATWDLGAGLWYTIGAIREFHRIGSMIMGWLTPTEGATGNLAKILLRSLIPGTRGISGLFEDWSEKMETFRFWAGLVYGVLKNIREVMEAMGKIIGDVLLGRWDELEESVESLTDALGMEDGLLGAFAAIGNRFWEKHIEPWYKEFVKVYNLLFGNTWSEDMETGWQNMWNEFGRTSGTVDLIVMQPLRNTFNNWRDTYFAPWRSDVEGEWSGIFGDQGFFRGVATAVDTNILQPIKDRFDEFKDEYFIPWKDSIEKLWDDMFGEDGFFSDISSKVGERIIDPISAFFTTFRDETWPGLLDPIKELWAYMWGNPDTGEESFFIRSLYDFLGRFVDWLTNHFDNTHGPWYNLNIALQRVEGLLKRIINFFNEVTNLNTDELPSGGGGGGGGGGHGNGSTSQAPPDDDDGFPACFVKGTPIVMINGNNTPIEYIEPGDIVLSFDPTTETFTSGVVTSTLSRDVDNIYRICTEGKVIQVTGEHPFYMPHSDKPKVHNTFVRAKDISAGDMLTIERKNSLVEINVLEVERVFKNVTVYNFNVDEHHTYFADGVAVHNFKMTQHGGLFTSPQVRVIAESGPEAVIPLRHGNIPVQMIGGGGDINLTVDISGNTFGSPEDAKKVADMASREILRKLRVRGVSTTGRF